MPGAIEAAGDTIYRKFTTRSSATPPVPTTLGGTPAISIYKDGSTTQSTAGVTLTVDFDGVTGLNHVAIDTSADGTFYSNGGHFEGVITTGTVGGASVVGEVAFSFDLEAAPDPWATSLPGSYSSGQAGKIVGDNLNATVSSRSTYAGADTSGTTTLLNRLTSTRAGYLDNLSGGAVALASGVVVASGGITSSSFAAGAITSTALAAGAITAIQSGLATASALSSVAGDVATIGGLAADIESVTAKLDTALELDGGVYRFTTNALEQAPTGGGGGPSAGDIADAVWGEALPGAYSSGTAGYIVGNRLDAAVSSRSTYAGADTSGTTTLLNRLTSTRSGYLDNLSGGAVALASGVVVVTNNDKTGYGLSGTQAFNLTGNITGNITGDLSGSVGSIAAGGIGSGSFAADAITAASLAGDAVAKIWARAVNELTTLPGIDAEVLDAISWLFTVARNKVTQTDTTQTVSRVGGLVPIASAEVSSDASTFTRGEFEGA